MRTLSTTLSEYQKKPNLQALVKIELTSGETSYTYDKSRIITIEQDEAPYSQTAKAVLDDSDRVLIDLDLRGWEAVISYGLVTSKGEEYSACPLMWVVGQEMVSAGGLLRCELYLEGIPDMLASDIAEVSYAPEADDALSVYELITHLFDATGLADAFGECRTYTVNWDSWEEEEDIEEDLIGTYQPKDGFRVYVGANRLAVFKRLLDYTDCVAKFDSDGEIHIFKPATEGDFDYEYSLTGGHTFFAKAYEKRLVIPNYVTVESQADDDPQYSGHAQHTASYNMLPKRDIKRMKLASDDEAEDIATAIIGKAKLQAKGGSGEVPLNVGAEVYDWVGVGDSRAGTGASGNIGWIRRRVDLRKKEWEMAFGFGEWANYQKLLNDIKLTDEGQVIERLSAKDLYAENIQTENLDIYWIDPEGNIDLDKIGDTLDNLPDGEVYARVKSVHLDAGGLKIDETCIYNAGYDPSVKRRVFNATPTTPYDVGDLWIDGTNPVKRCSTARATGAYVAGDWTTVTLDEIGNGTTYVRVKATDISAGHIKLTSSTSADGIWYDYSGVIIDADSGIEIQGDLDLIFTYDAYTGYIYCTSAGYLSIIGDEGIVLTGEVTLNADVLPAAGGTRDLGSSTYYFAGVYCDTIYRNSEAALDSFDDLAIIRAMKPDKKDPAKIDKSTIHSYLLEDRASHESHIRRNAEDHYNYILAAYQKKLASPDCTAKERAFFEKAAGELPAKREAWIAKKLAEPYEPMIDSGKMSGLLLGAVKQLAIRVEEMEREVKSSK